VPEPASPEKATLQEIVLPDGSGKQASPVGDPITVDFNPETLRVTYTNTIEGKDQRGGPALQYVAKSSTKLAVELWFDVTTDSSANDVRDRTKKVNALMTPKEKKEGKETKFVPPGVRFHWGSFLFDGVMESMDETLELFSVQGRPLRSRVSLSLTSQAIQFQFGTPGAQQTPGTEPRTQLRQGESLQQALGRSGRVEDWQAVAAANGIESPRLPQAGLFIDPFAGVSVR
jgi:hypothetical protein